MLYLILRFIIVSCVVLNSEIYIVSCVVLNSEIYIVSCVVLNSEIYIVSCAYFQWFIVSRTYNDKAYISPQLSGHLSTFAFLLNFSFMK